MLTQHALDAYPLTEQLLSPRCDTSRINGIVIGTLRDFDENGSPCVDYPGNTSGHLIARSTVSLSPNDRGREIAMLFESGDPARPIVIGMIHHPVPIPLPSVEVTKDGEKIVLQAEQEIELRCGKASITLTKAGKILIRGEYLLSRSSGVNRIKGGSVQIN